MSDEQTTLDADLIALMDAGIKIGMSAIPIQVSPEVRSIAEQAVSRAVLWLARQIRPDQIKVLVEAKADATAEIDWGEE
jgi:hypothetical protein